MTHQGQYQALSNTKYH